MRCFTLILFLVVDPADVCMRVCVCPVVSVSLDFPSSELSVCLENLSCADVPLIYLQGGFFVPVLIAVSVLCVCRVVCVCFAPSSCLILFGVICCRLFRFHFVLFSR